MTKPKQLLYLNKKQKAFLTATQKTKVLMMGRGAGKTAVIGPDTYMSATILPRAKTFFSSTTYNQILTKTLPEVEKMWNTMGLKEYTSPEDPGHYIVGKRPPKHFAKPYAPPRRYANVITFFNGFSIEMLSMDRPDLSRGGSYDGGWIDEAALVSQEAFNKVLLPTVRGNINHFSSAKQQLRHQQVSLLTSVPWKAKGQWILEYEEKAREFPSDYAWIEGTAFDNIDILGEKGLRRLKLELTEMEWRIEVMNERHIKIPDGFYNSLSMDIHSYTPQYRYKDGPRGIDTTGLTKEYSPTKPIDISFDFGGWFSCYTLWQEDSTTPGIMTERCFDLGYVKEDEKLDTLLSRFCYKYKDHRRKEIRIYGEPRGFDRNATGDRIYDVVKDQLDQHGWKVKIMIKPGYQSKEHSWRHHFLNDLLAERNERMPRIRINDEECRDLLFSMQTAPITRDMKKDKSKEKQREFPQEHATHLTDTFDYYFTQKYSRLYRGRGAGRTGGWFAVR